LAFSSSSKQLVSAGYGGNLLINDVAQQEPVAEYDGPSITRSLSLSPDGHCLIAGRTDGRVQAWEIGMGEGPLAELQTRQVAQDADTEVKDLAFAHGGQSVVIALENSEIQVRRTTDVTGHRVFRWSPPCLDIAPNSNRAVLQYPNGRIRLASFPPQESDGSLLPRAKPIREVVFFPQGDRLATVGVEPQVLVYDSVTKEPRHALESAGEAVKALAISLDGKYIAGSGNNGTVWLWNVETHAIVHTLRAHTKETVRSAFSPDGEILATGSSNEQQVLLWNISTGKIMASLQIGQDVMGLAFNPNASTLAVAGYDGVAMLWDVASRRRLTALHGHTGHLRGVTFSPDGKTLATVSDDGTARLWHVATGQELLTLTQRSRSLRWAKFLSPRQLAVCSEPYFPGPHGANDVFIFEAGEPSFGSANGEW
jgi:WD40 repeat protein